MGEISVLEEIIGEKSVLEEKTPKISCVETI